MDSVEFFRLLALCHTVMPEEENGKLVYQVGRDTIHINCIYREGNKGLYVVARDFFLLLLNCSAWPCLGPAEQDRQMKDLRVALLRTRSSGGDALLSGGFRATLLQQVWSVSVSVSVTLALSPEKEEDAA